MDITLDDLLALEPRLAPAHSRDSLAVGNASIADREVSWAVSARATAPHLPSLRGKELLLIGPRAAEGLAAEPDDSPLRRVSLSDREQISRHLPSGGTVVLGPLRPEQRVVARFLSDRIAAGVAAALQRDDAARPRGARRAEATAALLTDQ